MTTYRILPDGRRRALPDGTIRAVGQPGPASTALTPVSASLSFAGSVAITAVAIIALAPASMAFGGQASITSESVGPRASGSMTFGGGVVGAQADVILAPSPATTTFAGSARGSVSVPVSVAPGSLVFDGSARIAQNATATVATGTLTFGGTARAALDAVITPAPGTLTFGGSAAISVNTAEKWLSIWEAVYAQRQVVLNAIDANNRFLAKQAGDKATATADALIITNTNVTAIDDRVTAEAERLSLLTTELEGLETTTGQALDSLRTTVEQNGDDIEANSEAITVVNAAIAGKADASALSTLTARTEVVEGQVSSQAQAITAVTATANGAQTTAGSALTAANDAASIATQAMFEAIVPFTPAAGWEFTANHRDFTAVGAILGQWPITANDGATVVESNSNDPNFISPVFTLAGGANPVIRAMVRRRDSSAWEGLVFWSNNSHGFSPVYAAPTPAPPVGEWAVVEWDLRENADFRSSPLNRLRFDLAAQSGAIVDVKWIALGNYGQGRMAQVTETMRAGIDATTGRLNATAGLAVRVDGKIIGYRFANDGVIGRADFVGDAIGFFPPDGAATGMELTPGNTVIRQFGAGWQRIQSAIPFGPDNLVMYFGPNVGVSGASKAFATKWEDATGNCYTGGSFSAGVLRNAAQSTQLSTAAEADTGSFATNGNQRVVASSLSYENAGISQTSLGADVALTATVVMERSRNDGGAWEQVSSFNATGQRSLVSFEPGVGYLYQFEMRGSTTFTDNSGGTADVRYRLRIVSASGPWPFNFGTGSSPLGRQSLSILSTEQ